jgi:hypothetical protein
MRTHRRTLLAFPAAVIVALAVGAPSFAATPKALEPAASHAAHAPSTDGIIMRDGGICDPIRWGC